MISSHPNTLKSSQFQHIPFSIGMRSGNHLRKINHGDMVMFIQNEIEFIEVSMNQPMIRKSDDEFHCFIIHRGRIFNMVDLTSENILYMNTIFVLIYDFNMYAYEPTLFQPSPQSSTCLLILTSICNTSQAIKKLSIKSHMLVSLHFQLLLHSFCFVFSLF